MTYSTAFPLTLPSLTSDHRQQLLAERPLLSLYEAFATLPDPRSKHGLRYELAYLLICLVAGLLCNCDSTLAVAQWCRDQHLLLIRLFGPRRFLRPSDSLYRKLLPRLDAEQIECTLADWIRSTLQAALEEVRQSEKDSWMSSSFCVSYSSRLSEKEILILIPFLRQIKPTHHARGGDV